MKKLNLLICTNLTIIILLTGISGINGQSGHDHDRVIRFPDIPGYKTLVCDFHQHTVFSDGSVWPDIRIQEAVADGLDAVSITDHLEYQPHKDDLPHPDRNRGFIVAMEENKGSDLLLLRGSEITRDMPPGHCNAIFIQDANKLLAEDPMDVFREAKQQGAFIFWNHPHWIAQNPKGTSELTDMHRKLISEGLINGIEVVNDLSYSDEALQIALDNNLTIMGSSDIHGLIDWQYKVPQGGHRPVTLVFAEEKSEAALKDALLKGRTAVWFDNFLIGKTGFLVPLIQQSLTVEKTEVLSSHTGESTVVAVTIRNHSDVDYIFENKSDYSFYSHGDVFTIQSHDQIVLEVKTLKAMPAFELRFRAMNAIVAPNTHPLIVLNVLNK